MRRRSYGQFCPVVRPRRRRWSGFEWLEGRRLLSMAPLPLPPTGTHHGDFAFLMGPPIGAMETFQHVRSPSVFASAVEHDLKQLQPPSATGDPLSSLAITVRMPPLLGNLNDHGGERTDNRYVIFVQISDAAALVADALVHADHTEAQPFRFFGLAHEWIAEARLAVVSLDLIRPAALSPEDAGSESGGERHSLGAPVLGIQGRQSAESGSSLDLGSPSAGAESISVQDSALQAGGTLAARGGTAVSHLVAFDGDAVGSAAGPSSADDTPGLPHWERVASALQELLPPRISWDAAALGVAVADLLEEADGMGVGLLSMLSDSTGLREVALVAGLAGVGFASRHGRGGRPRQRAEAREMLSASFIGRAPLRLGGRRSL